MRRTGVRSSKTTTASTARKAARTAARSLSATMGRSGPLPSPRTDLSELRPTTRASPRERASSRYATCPGCKRSKQPLVKTIRPPHSRRALRPSGTSLMVRIAMRPVYGPSLPAVLVLPVPGRVGVGVGRLAEDPRQRRDRHQSNDKQDERGYYGKPHGRNLPLQETDRRAAAGLGSSYYSIEVVVACPASGFSYRPTRLSRKSWQASRGPHTSRARDCRARSSRTRRPAPFGTCLSASVAGLGVPGAEDQTPHCAEEGMVQNR